MRASTTRSRHVRFGVFEADLHVCELRKHGLRIKLAGQPFQALAQLLESGGTVVTRDDLRQRLWPNEPWGEHDQRLNNIMNKIREALGDSADNPRFVETLPRIGYRFLVNVEFVSPAVPAAPSEPVSESGAHEAALPPPPAPRLAPSLTWRWLALALASTAAGALMVFWAFRPSPAPAAPVAHAVPLTTHVGSELYPSLSPDGARVVFAWDGESGANFHIYTSPVAGGTPQQLTSGAVTDSSPVWSPDGRQIAFLREATRDKAELWVIGADGRDARKVREVRSQVPGQSLAWTRNADWLLVSQTLPGKSSHGLYRISLADGGEIRLSEGGPERSAGDLNPAVSPDGTLVAFTRSTSSAWSDVFVARLSPDGQHLSQPRRLTEAHTIAEHLTWLPDSSAILFAGATTNAGARHLYRVNAAPGAAQGVVELGIEGDYPTVAGFPWKLAFVRKNIEQSSTWRIDLTQGLTQPKQYRLLSSTRRDYTTDLSPDGVHMVFSSVRSGPTEIWMSETNGSGLKRLTSIGGTTPRWSPDGKQIVFESNHRGQSDIYVLTPATGEQRRLTNLVATNKRPSWSRDGRFVYFSSDSTGQFQIWKVPSQGGDAVQLTRSGGMYAVETFDGKSIYYTSADVPADIWTAPSAGGEETRVIRNVVGLPTVAMAREGLYYLSRLTGNSAQLDFYRFADHQTLGLATLDHPVHRFLSSSPDGKSVLYSQVDRRDSDLMLIDGFR